MSKRAETTKEILQQEQKKSQLRLKLNQDKNLLAGKWVLLFSVLFSLITGGLAGYLTSYYWQSFQSAKTFNPNLNANIIDFTKKITLTDPDTLVINKLTKQIVAIYAVKKGNWWQKLYLDEEFLGSGLIVTSDGWLMTTSEVISDFEKDYQIMTTNRLSYLAKEFVKDDLTGVVFLKIEAENLSPVQFADLDEVQLAQETVVLAADNNMADTRIKISNLEKLDYYFQRTPKDYFHSTERQDEYFLLKDRLPPNFSGSLVANFHGEVIGLGQNVEQTENFQTIIPADYLSQAVRKFLINKTEVERNYLGLTYFDLAQNLNLAANITAGKNQGTLIIGSQDLNLVAIKKDSPAKNILEEGDIILQVNNEIINNRNNFTKLIQDYPRGSKIKMLIFRDGEEKEVEIILE